MTSSSSYNPPPNYKFNSNSNSNSSFNSNPNLSLHLTDTSLTPLLSASSSSSNPSTSNRPPDAKSLQSPSLTTLSTTALSAYNSSLHLNLGQPQRIIVETEASGPVLLHSFISPSSTRFQKPAPSLRHSTSMLTHISTHANTQNQINGLEHTNGASSTRGLEILSAAREELRPLSGMTEDSHAKQEHHDLRDEGAQVPLLVGTVVARSAEQMGEARRAAHRIEIAAHGFQRELIKSAEEKREAEDEGTAGDG
ncbi:hypothetical protein DSL72_002904 [Monilinia vaccinii-corymbosi]|uniref:Uncharacterized protein n=1 Tax=Monilinia vaccinii-corymbosi TaxID=61207 RepID=A0A8A3PE31_9HELO|nr:hypothetical protein DSL72_002904 [Monilinia vaccinii-corymbosi]